MKKIYGWCLQNKNTKELEPLESHHIRWEYGYGLFGTRKELIENAFNNVPQSYKAVRVEIKLKLTK